MRELGSGPIKSVATQLAQQTRSIPHIITCFNLNRLAAISKPT